MSAAFAHPGSKVADSSVRSASKCLLAEVVRVEESVRARLGGRVQSFRLEMIHAGLVLRGRAPTYYVKCLAQHAVMENTAIPIADNRIEVHNPVFGD